MTAGAAPQPGPQQPGPQQPGPQQQAGTEVFEYAVIRVVPRVERGEAINVGVIVYSQQFRYLCARVELDDRTGCWLSIRGPISTRCAAACARSARPAPKDR